MIIYHNFSFKSNENCVILSADVIIQFDRMGDESYRLRVPTCWVDILRRRINLEDYRICSVYSKTMPHSQCNRITDYKKVWGLVKTSPGDYDGTYDTRLGRVYFGIKEQSGIFCDVLGRSPIVVLIPKTDIRSLDLIFSEFKKVAYDFSCYNHTLLSDIQSSIPESIILYSLLSDTISLSVFCQNPDTLFTERDIQDLRERWK